MNSLLGLSKKNKTTYAFLDNPGYLLIMVNLVRAYAVGGRMGVFGRVMTRPNTPDFPLNCVTPI